jgi:hypothetical protein
MAAQASLQEIELSEYQANVFVEAENILRNDGYLGEDLFEDTYVIQKAMVEYITMNITDVGTSAEISSDARQVYNGVLDIVETAEEPTPDPSPTPSSPRRSGSPRKSRRPLVVGAGNPLPEQGITQIRQQNIEKARNNNSPTTGGGPTRGGRRNIGGGGRTANQVTSRP